MTIITRRLKGIINSRTPLWIWGSLLLALAVGCETPQVGQKALKKRLDKVESEVMTAEADTAAELEAQESQSSSAIANLQPSANTSDPSSTAQATAGGSGSQELDPDTESQSKVTSSAASGVPIGADADASDTSGASLANVRPDEQETVPPHRNWESLMLSDFSTSGSSTSATTAANVSEVKELENTLNKYLSTQRYAEAKKWVNDLTDISTNTRSYLDRLIRDDLLKKTMVLSDQLVTERKYFTAYRLIKKSELGAQLQDVLTQIIAQGTQFYLTQSQLRYETGRSDPSAKEYQLSRSYLEAFKALEMKPESTTAQSWYERCRSEMQPSLQAKVVIGGVTVNGKRAGNAGRYFANRLQNEIQLPTGFQLEKGVAEEDDLNQVWAQSASSSEALYLVTAQVSNTLSDENLEAWVRDAGDSIGNTAPILGVGEAFISILDLSLSDPVMVETPPLSISLRIRDFPGVSFNSGIEEPLIQARNTVERELLSQLADGVQIYVQRAFDNRARQRLIDWRNQAKPKTLMTTSEKSIQALAKGILYCRELGLDSQHPVRRQLEEIYLQRLTERDFLN